ncbi:hypothetical protein LTR53_007058 [Teratosphaeriaceae sp. CCFEE 6253]|nr:hypothetical protein LTR53_007058 [Teratosphaeriaceae sp. CCFEE 6253]
MSYRELREPPNAMYYEALSYTWGRTTRDEAIELRPGTLLPITDNLAQALYRMRYLVQARVLWVDALCIDQSSLEERSEQVAYMADIYRRAWRVTVWLGELPPALPMTSTAQLLGVLGLSDCLLYLRKYAYSGWLLSQHQTRLQQALDMTLADAQPRWHERMWTVQEFVLAHNVVFCYGPFAWHQLGDLESQFGPLPPGSPASRSFPHLTALLESFEALGSLRMRIHGSRHYGLDMVHAAVHTSDRACKDPRDKVYGLLGMLAPKEAANIRPSYTQPVAQTFSGATFSVILGADNLDILTLVSISDNLHKSLASWVVDFMALDGLKSLGGPRFGAIIDNGSGEQLIVTGVRFDLVERVVSVSLLPDHWQAAPKVEEAADMLAHLVEDFQKRFSMPTAYGKSIWRDSRLFTEKHSDGVRAIQRRFAASRPRDPLDFLEETALAANSICKAQVQPIKWDMAKYGSYLGSIHSEASVMVTSGGLCALAPAAAEPGDIIVVVDGAYAPVLLRPHRGGLRFRGFVLLASYGHEPTMNSFWKRNGVNMETFILS